MNGGKGKGASSSTGGFDYSKYMSGSGYSQYMPGADKSKDSKSAPGGFDYSQYTKGFGGKGAPSTMMVVENAPAVKQPAPPQKAAEPAPEKAAEPAPAKADAPPVKDESRSQDAGKGYAGDYSKYMDGYGDYSKYMKSYGDYSKYMSGGGGGGGGGKDSESPQDMVKNMMKQNKTSAEIGDAFKSKYAGSYIKEYGHDASKSDAKKAAPTDIKPVAQDDKPAAKQPAQEQKAAVASAPEQQKAAVASAPEQPKAAVASAPQQKKVAVASAPEQQ